MEWSSYLYHISSENTTRNAILVFLSPCPTLHINKKGSREISGSRRTTMLWIAATTVVGCLVLAWMWRMLEWLWLKPRRLEWLLRAQGLRGTPYRPPFGDLNEEGRLIKEAWSKPISPISHCIIPRVAPMLHSAIQQHGKMPLTWFGPNPQVSITDPDLIREILSNKYGNIQRPESNPLVMLLVTGLATYNGEKWAKHRRIINPAFHQEKLKRMLPAFSTCCDELISRWEKIACSEGSSELDVWPELKNFSADVISRAAFGSSYKEGRYLFQLQEEQTKLGFEASQNLYIPGYRFLPTRKNNRRKQIYIEVQEILLSMIQQRERATQEGQVSGHDLLSLLIESNLRHTQEHNDSKNIGMTKEDVIEECKLFYFAGHETTSVLLTWTMILLSMNPTWQESAREEILQIFGKNKPEFDDLSRLKIVTMIIYEVLRLYPPVIMQGRQTCNEVKLGGITFPPGVQLLLPTIHMHHDLEIWGEDACEFKPERFSEGVSKASKSQGAFFPFGLGPQNCIGQGFAMLEAKMGLASILQHFSFELSPSYTHAPYNPIMLQPQYGAQVILNKL